MSRTDKDRPIRVRKHDSTLARTPWHDHLSLGKTHRRWAKGGLREHITHECDIDVMSPPNDFTRTCDWMLADYSAWYEDGPPTKADRHIWWHSQDRARSRSSLHDLARSWDGQLDELDDSAVVTEQHRGRQSPGGGWWW